MISTATALDMDKVNTFAFKVVGDITSVMMDTLGAIADRHPIPADDSAPPATFTAGDAHRHE